MAEQSPKYTPADLARFTLPYVPAKVQQGDTDYLRARMKQYAAKLQQEQEQQSAALQAISNEQAQKVRKLK